MVNEVINLKESKERYKKAGKKSRKYYNCIKISKISDNIHFLKAWKGTERECKLTISQAIKFSLPWVQITVVFPYVCFKSHKHHDIIPDQSSK